MTNSNFREAQEKAEELLKKYKITEPIVPIFQIAQEEGIELKFVKMPQKLENIAGFFYTKKKKNVIFVNDDDAPNRQTFTIAHELGHYILKHKNYGMLPRVPNLTEKTPVEQEANCFAANLLVPLDMLIEVMRKHSLTKSDTSLLAEIFGVSEQVIKYRSRWIYCVKL